MLIWDFIRDFFVQYIFGGYTSVGSRFSGILGRFINNGGVNTLASTSDNFFEVGEYKLCLGDWLSTTATIIVMCLIVFLLICLVRWIFRAVSSAMLLK